jgi:hypothetical protein
MKKCIAIVVFALFVAALLSAQSITNPSDSFYADVQIWESLGYVSSLPPLRPYPEPLVRSILDEVIANGSPLHVKKAQYQYERLFGKRFTVGAEAVGTMALSDQTDTQYQLDGSALLLGNAVILDMFFINFDLNLLLSNVLPGHEIFPRTEGYSHDTYVDKASIESFNLYTSFNSLAAVGNEKMWFQAGLSRSSWGDFPDNGVVLGPQAYHTGNFSFVINQDKWNYTLALFVLAAQKNTGNFYGGSSPEKFMTMHSVAYSPLPWLSLSFYENMVYGKRFEPLYLLPISPFMMSQQLVGFSNDNLQMGVSVEVKPFKGFSWAANIFVDDAHLMNLLKFNFDTKLKIAAQTGITWIPDLPFSSAVFLDYTLVAPYMYSHEQKDADGVVRDDTVNYQDYLNKGRSIGTALLPNSHRVSLRGKFEFIENLRVSPSITFIQHANINESIPLEDAIDYLEAEEGRFNTDGGIMDNPNAGEGYFDYAQEHFMFFAQDTKQNILQLGLDAAWDLPKFKIGTLSLTLGYVFEFINNDGIDRHMFPGKGTLWAESASQAEKEQAVADAKNAWKAGLTDTVNHYFSLGIRFVF